MYIYIYTLIHLYSMYLTNLTRCVDPDRISRSDTLGKDASWKVPWMDEPGTMDGWFFFCLVLWNMWIK